MRHITRTAPTRHAAIALPLLGAATLLLAGCGSAGKPASAHTSSPSPSPTAAPTVTAPLSPAASLPPTAMDVFKAQYDKIDNSAWTNASLGMKDAQTRDQIEAVLSKMLTALQTYGSAVTALQPPPDGQLTAPLSQPKSDLLAAVAALETQVKKLQADVQRGDQSAFNSDGNGPYKDAYDALMGAQSKFDMAVQLDAGS